MELDTTANAIIIKSLESEVNSIIKINDKEIEEMKIKKDAISFFTISRNLKNPIKPEFTIFIYTVNNIIIEMVFECDEVKTLEGLEEYIKSILI
jgi:hypothetical protein